MVEAVQSNGTWSSKALRGLVNPAEGLLDRRIFADEELYRLELKQIVARAWNFMCHESQIPNAGDYFINSIGEDQVIVVRNREGKINVLVNTCRHRGNALCRAEQGNARSFVCSYHAWNFGLDGELIGVPGQKNYYRDNLDRSKWGLAKAAQVDSYNGFYFATMDPDAPSLYDYLGEVGRVGLSIPVAHGDVVALEGVQKNVIDCNWKISVDNLFDWYHVMYSHASANATGFVNLSEGLSPNNQMVMLGEYGHAISGPGVPREFQDKIDGMNDEERRELSATLPPQRRVRPRKATELMGPSGVRSYGHPNIFPNLWVATGGMQLCLRLPRGPLATELWWFTFVPKNAPAEVRRNIARRATHVFGPAGFLEQDDGENWSQSTRASFGVTSRNLGHNVSMALGQDQVTVENGQSFIETSINEHAQRWLYRAWSDWMAARDWADLKANHSPAPTGRV